MSDQEADLASIVCQLQHLITDMGAMRDDLAVLKAILQRRDGTISDLLNELRAMNLHLK
jgi:hypothetical protein